MLKSLSRLSPAPIFELEVKATVICEQVDIEARVSVEASLLVIKTIMPATIKDLLVKFAPFANLAFIHTPSGLIADLSNV
jgi:hypothetical protein